jgi:hypothetical protein
VSITIDATTLLELAEVHRPKVVSSPRRTVCASCAEWMGYQRGLRRVDWPCQTAELLRLDAPAPKAEPEPDQEIRCSNCYDALSGPWCDACDTWPCMASTCGRLAEAPA